MDGYGREGEADCVCPRSRLLVYARCPLPAHSVPGKRGEKKEGLRASPAGRIQLPWALVQDGCSTRVGGPLKRRL